MIKPNIAQKQAIISLNKSIKKGDNKFLVILPSGLGKTIYSSLVVKKEMGNILYLVHRREILNQAIKEFEKVGHNPEEFGLLNNYKKQIGKRYLFATIQSLSRIKTLNKFNRNHFQFIICDECHHIEAKTYKRVINYFKGYKLLGLTATPYRLDGKNVLKSLNNNIVYDMNMQEGINRKFLVPINYNGLYDDIDYSDIKYKGYGYTQKDLNKKLLINKRDKKIIKEFKKRIGNKQTIGFCVSVKHTKRCVKKFKEAGINCDSIIFNTKREKREEIIKDFEEKRLQIIFTRDIFNEGVNFPEVEALLFLRPTISKTIFLQQLGRGLRKAKKKKEVIVLDFIGNYVNAWKIQKWLGEIIPKGTGGRLSSKPTYNFNISKIHFEAKVIKLFETQIERNITKDKLIKDYFRMKKKLNRLPTYLDFKGLNKKSRYSMGSIRVYFGSWKKFLKEIREPIQKPSTEKLINYYKSIKNIKKGKKIKIKDFKKYDYRKYLKRFNCKNFREVLNYFGEAKISKEYIKKDLIRIKNKIKRVPYEKEWIREHKGYPIRTVYNLFGSYNKFLKCCGYDSFQKRIKNKHKLDKIKIYKRVFKKLGRKPTMKEFIEIGKTNRAIYNHFKSFEELCKCVKLENEKR